jgi:hypothetical protein
VGKGISDTIILFLGTFIFYHRRGRNLFPINCNHIYQEQFGQIPVNKKCVSITTYSFGNLYLGNL